MMNDPLVVFEENVFLLGEIVRLECDFQIMSRLGRSLEIVFLALVDSLEELEIGVTFLGLLA